MPKRSTVTNLTDKKQQVHGILLAKLSAVGFSESTVEFIDSYLSNRSSYVTYNGFKSTPFIATSGVPQGSNLGPLLFNIYINDLLTELSGGVLAYADDLKIYAAVSSLNDCGMLQSDLVSISEWSRKNKIKIRLNIDKCMVVTYFRDATVVKYDYNVEGVGLRRQEEVVDLGVVFDARLTFDAHIAGIVGAATRTLGFVMRSCKGFRDITTLKRLYCAFVRSRLEYASVVWHPHYVFQQLALERVQRRFLRYISFKSTGVYPGRGADYDQLLHAFGFSALSTRRDFMSSRFLLKIVNGEVDAPALLSRIGFVVPRLNARHSNLFFVPRARTNILLKSPIVHMARNGNRLL